MRHPHTGMTLIELILGCAILSILAGLTLPAMSHIATQAHVGSTLSALMAQMQLARQTAILRNHRTLLCPSDDGHTCTSTNDWSGGWILFADDDGNRRPDRSTDILRVEQAPLTRHLRIISNSGRTYLRYLPDGSSAGSNLTLSICSPRGQLLGRVVVNNVGRPRSERLSGSAPCPA